VCQFGALRFITISGVSHFSVQAAAAAVDQESCGATPRSSICRRDMNDQILLTLEEVVERCLLAW
jgi:hypothetical protein